MSKVLLGLLFIASFFVNDAFAQGMRERCPMCGRNWNGQYEGEMSIPKELPKPENQKWLDNLREVLSLEEDSKNQYTSDSGKFQTNMPYAMVIPQEDNHIAWIKKLSAAYSISTEVKVPPVKQLADLTRAYQYAMKIESDLITRYEWLIKNAEDDTARNVLDTTLLQSRMHYTMFNHALMMGGMMGGRGGMGSMMGNRGENQEN